MTLRCSTCSTTDPLILQHEQAKIVGQDQRVNIYQCDNDHLTDENGKYVDPSLIR